jgi:hypothetical protein
MCFADVHVEVFCICVFQVLQDLQVTAVVHLGDISSSSLLQALVHSSCKVPVHVRAFEESLSTHVHICKIVVATVRAFEEPKSTHVHTCQGLLGACKVLVPVHVSATSAFTYPLWTKNQALKLHCWQRWLA